MQYQAPNEPNFLFPSGFGWISRIFLRHFPDLICNTAALYRFSLCLVMGPPQCLAAYSNNLAIGPLSYWFNSELKAVLKFARINSFKHSGNGIMRWNSMWQVQEFWQPPFSFFAKVFNLYIRVSPWNHSAYGHCYYVYQLMQLVMIWFLYYKTIKVYV